MKRSAMLQAFRVLARKPMVLLLLLPIQALSVLSLLFMPDFSQIMSIGNVYPYGSGINEFMQQFMMQFMGFFLVVSVVSTLSFAAMFLLNPPSMELLGDGAAGAQTQPGWFLRGLRRHWWKPVVDSLVVGAATGIVATVAYFVLLIPMMFLIPMLSIGAAGAGFNQTILVSMAVGIVIGLFLAALIIFVTSLFAVFLPALADRTFGGAFKLCFSKTGFKKAMKAFGGYLLLSVASTAIIAVFAGVYILLYGIPQGELGIIILEFKFFGSWAGILAFLFSSALVAVQTAFRFSLYQQIKDGESATAIL